MPCFDARSSKPMGTLLALMAGALAALAVAACRDVTPPQAAGPMASPNFTVTPLWPDTIGICIGAGSPTGNYTFSWVIENGQPGDIHDVTSPTTETLGAGDCLAPWRRTDPLPTGVSVTLIATEVATPPGVALDSVEVQDVNGDNVYLSSPTEAAVVDATSGGALTYYHTLLGKPLVLVNLLPLPSPVPSLASGRVQVVRDLRTPPSPCGSVHGALGADAVAVCGTIHNPGGETFTDGALTVGGAVIHFGAGAVPPNPCRQYVVHGSFAVPADVATQLASDPTGFTLRFDSKEHPDGAIGGSPAGGAVTGSAGAAPAEAGASSQGRGACVVRFGF